MKKLILLFVLGVALGSVACQSEEDASDVVILLRPSALRVSAGEKVYFDISVRTLHEKIVDFTVGTFDPILSHRTVYSINPCEQSFETQYVYEPENYPTDSVVVEMTFLAKDNLGNIQEASCQLKVLGDKALLPEKSGFSLYAPRSGKPDGFSLATCLPLLCSASDSSQIDIFQYYAEDVPADILGREWRTMTDVQFVKVNSFNYAAATREAITSSYAASLRQNFVKELANDDVILVGRGEQVWGSGEDRCGLRPGGCGG